jgi:hypothetical protein
MLLIPMTLLAIALSGWALVSFHSEGKVLVRFRRGVFVLGTAANLVSTVALLIFLIMGYKMAHGTMRPIDLDRVYPVPSMLGLGFLAAVLALFGRRISRVLLLVAGLLAGYTWYLAALAVSP